MIRRIVPFFRKIQQAHGRFLYWLIVVSIAVAVLLSTLNIYNFHLKVDISERYTVYYDAGSILLEHDDLIQQYITRRDTYFTNYFHSLYEPQVIIGEDTFTVYRQETKQIQWNGDWYYYNLGEEFFTLTDNPSDIDMYNRNFIIGPSLTLYGDPSSAFNYSFGEAFESYAFNYIEVETPCTDHELARCTNRLESYTEKVSQHEESDSAFEYSSIFSFGDELSFVEKTPTESFIIPEGFMVCSDPEDMATCQDPRFQGILPQRDIPVIIYKDGDVQKLRFEDLGLNSFHITNLKIPDYLILDDRLPILMNPSSTYYLVHHQSGVVISITPQQDVDTFVETKFSAIKFKPKDPCVVATCQLDFVVDINLLR